ncbi:sensor domain-containing phosphodiesterase [Aquipuribacter nitratireducens]|uniref:EAL domain-containing protein n=1 Tax=Aquipuribacter nitratireducens TaxID=650104 RepID=A0ABW0GPK6_9MICO
MVRAARTGPVDLPGLVKVAGDLAAGRREDADETLQVVVSGLREYLGLDVAFLGEFRGGRRRFRVVSEAPGHHTISPGEGDPIEETFCARVVAGRAPEHIPDAEREPGVNDLPIGRTLGIGTYLSVPVRLSDGSVYGTLCGFTHEPDPLLQERELGVLRLLARLLATHLERERRPDAELDEDRARVAQAIAGHAAHVVVQPVLSLRDRSVVGYEALSRFPDGAPPDGWFALATTVGLGVELEAESVRTALGVMPALRPGTYLAVNASAAALCSSEVSDVLAALDDATLQRVVVELTEQTGIADYDELRARLAALRARGVRVAVDDAGSGHAGLHRILEVSPDLIKLDRTLVQGVAGDEVRQSLVSALTWFSRRSGAQVVAEGIETEADARVLARLGVPFGQGLLLGAPGPVPS